MTQRLMRVRDLRVTFSARQRGFRAGRYEVSAVDGVDLTVDTGEVVGLVGESGCGKTTIGRAMLRLRPPSGGSIVFRDVDISRMTRAQSKEMHRQVQAVFQDPYDSLNPRLTVARIIEEPMVVHDLYRGRRKERVREVLEMVGLATALAERHPNELSGGQRQRVGIARALAPEPALLVCDEPVSALDVSVQAQVISVFRRLRQELALAQVFIAHDLSVVRYLADRVAVMYAGRLVEIGPTRQVIELPRHPYTQALLAAVPAPDPTLPRRAREGVAGEPPSLVDPPPGCRFHPRCPFAREICSARTPALEALPDGRHVACHRWRELGAGRAG